MQQIGSYEVDTELGSGTFGTVYRAFGVVPGSSRKPRWVAVKVLRDATDQSAWETFRHEFGLLEQVKHRSVCRVYELIEDPGAVVMEYIHGLTLRDLMDACIERSWAIPVEVVAELGSEIADCLYQTYYGHDEEGRAFHLVHRDLKPENILLTPNGEVKVVDFGLARRGAVGRRFERGREGTPLYMSPEQARGDQIDHRTDIFAVGLILFELLMNCAAYEMSGIEDAEAVKYRIENGELEQPLRELMVRHKRIGGVIARCLASEVSRRTEDGHTLMLELTSLLSLSSDGPLRNFCGEVFQDLYTLAELPVASEGFGATGTRAMISANRRAEGMSKKTPPRPGAPPRPGGAKKPARPSPSPRSGPPSGSAARPSSGGKASGGWSPPAAKASAPKKAPPQKKVKAETSARSPNESGMLQMVSMDSEEDGDNLQKKKSATAFFSIPTPKRKATAEPEQGSSGPPPAAPVASVASAGQASLPPGMASLPPGAIGSLGGIGISGPVAGGLPSSPGTPFGVASQPPMAGVGEESRSQSYRVYLIIAGLVGALMLALIVVTFAIVAGVVMKGEGDSSSSSASTATVAPSPKPTTQVRDTGTAPPPTITVSSKPAPRPSPGPRPSAPRPKAGPQPISVVIGDSSRFTSIEVSCPSGFRQRGSFSGKTATVPGVPIEECTVNFKGGVPSKTTIRGGQTKTCTWVGPQAKCR